MFPCFLDSNKQQLILSEKLHFATSEIGIYYQTVHQTFLLLMAETKEMHY